MLEYGRIRPPLHSPCQRLAPLKYGKGTSAVAKRPQDRASAPSMRDRIHALEYLARTEMGRS